MAIDPEKLLSYRIPDGRQVLTPRDAAIYALSIGLGQSPLDEEQLAFVDVSRPLKVLPSIAFVLAHPGFWYADPATSIDPSGMLHADQSLELLAPVSASGLVTSSTRIIKLIDKGPGKAALMRTETLLRNESKQPTARMLRTVYLRGGGGFGGENETISPTVQPPSDVPDHVVDLPTRPEQPLLYRLNGDLNPLHASPSFALKAGFERPILHGLCTAGIVCHAILRAVFSYDEQRIGHLRLRFTGIVYPGETIRTEIWSNGQFRARVLGRNAVVIDEGSFGSRAQAL